MLTWYRVDAPPTHTASSALNPSRSLVNDGRQNDGRQNDGAPASATNGEAAPAARVDGEIRTRDDVVRTLERLCDYFRKHEPSSPVPLLLQRAKSLVAKDFLAILRELTPDGVAQAEVIVGVEKKEE